MLLKELRIEKGLTQMVVGGRAGINPTTYSLIERGYRPSTMSERLRIAAALGIDHREIEWSDGNEIRREWLREQGEVVRNAR